MQHNKFLVIPFDEASGKIAIVCQRYYAQILIIELGENNANNVTSTYTKETKPVGKIVSENASFLKHNFNIEVTETNQKTFQYKLLNLHKNPTKAKSRITVSKCSVKPLPKSFTA